MDAGGHVFHVFIAKFFRGFSGFLVSFALRAAAVGDDERVLVRWQRAGELVFDGFKIQRGGHMAFLVGLGAVDVQDDGLLGFGECFDFLDADVGEFTGVAGDGEQGNGEEGEELFHGNQAVVLVFNVSIRR